MEVKITPTTYEDCLDLAAIMRQSDIDEIYATNHSTPEQGLLLGFYNSIVIYTVKINGELIMIYGISKLPFVHGVCPWMLASENIEKYGVTFYRHTRKHILAMIKQYGYLENYVDSRNVKSIKWLSWLGFTIHDAEPYGIEQRLFHRFSMTIK